MSKSPSPDKYPIHISIGGLYLCGNRNEITPPPIRLMADDEWHSKRPICKYCQKEHIIRFGKETTWHKQ